MTWLSLCFIVLPAASLRRAHTKFDISDPSSGNPSIFESIKQFFAPPPSNMKADAVPSTLATGEGLVPMVNVSAVDEDASTFIFDRLQKEYETRNSQNLYASCLDILQLAQSRTAKDPCSSKASAAIQRLQSAIKFCNDVPNFKVGEFVTAVNSVAGEYDSLCVGMCTSPCQHGGRCVGANFCQCPPGFSGATCEHTFCSPPCNLEHGQCTAGGKCICDPGFSGVACENNDNFKVPSTTNPPRASPQFFFGADCEACVNKGEVWCLQDAVCVTKGDIPKNGSAPSQCPRTLHSKEGPRISRAWPPLLVSGRTDPCSPKYAACASKAQNLILTTNRVTVNAASICEGVGILGPLKAPWKLYMDNLQQCRHMFIESVPRTLGDLEINTKYEAICHKLKASFSSCLSSYKC